MRLHYSKRFVAWAFVLMVLVSSINLVLAGRNYALLYAALNQLQFSIPRMILQNTEQNRDRILVQVDADNPVDYGGLKVTLVYISAYFKSLDSSIFRDSPLQNGWTISETLSPHSSTSFNLTIVLNQQNGTALSTFLVTNPSGVAANAYLVVGISSFLYTLTGRLSYYPASQNLTLTSSS